MGACAVFGCSSNTRNSGKSGLRFYRFPRDKKTCRKWKIACRRADKYDARNARVCSRHFLKSDYSPRSDGATWGLKATRALKPGAEPSIHIPSKPHAGVCEPRRANKLMESHQTDSHHVEESHSRNICTASVAQQPASSDNDASEPTLMDHLPTTTTNGASDFTLLEAWSPQTSTIKVCWTCCVCLPDQSKLSQISHKLEKMTQDYKAKSEEVSILKSDLSKITMEMNDIRNNEKRKTEELSSLLNKLADTRNELNTMRLANLSQQEELRKTELENKSLKSSLFALRNCLKSSTISWRARQNHK